MCFQVISNREALAMVYVLHKFRHYLLGKKFVFYVEHMALLHLVKNPQLSSRIVRQLLLLLEYNFLVVYKPWHSHLVVEAFLQLFDVTNNSRVLDRTTEASLFVLQSKWLQEVHTYISIGNFPKGYSTKQ